MTTYIKNQPPTEEIRQRLKDENRTVLVAMSLGKDAIAANLALKDAGIHTELAYMYLVPGREPGKCLDFIEDTITRLEDGFGQPIHRYPHPSLWRWLNNFIFQPPERCAIIEAARMPELGYNETWELIKEDLGLPSDTWVADGVRAADSIPRRASLSRHGIMKAGNHKVSPVADWVIAELRDRLRDADLPLPWKDKHGVPLPIDYKWFGRSFDGLDYRFIEPLKRNAPRDYAQLLEWFPLAELEIFRHEHIIERSN